MKHILISGYYGFRNLGDEAILRQLLENLRAARPGDEITVLSHDPTWTAEQYGVRSVKRMDPLTLLRELIRCDLLISGGGSLLQDATSSRSLSYYLLLLRMAKLLGKKVFLYSQGIGPLREEGNRRRTAKTLRRVDGIVVRDADSHRLLSEIGLDVSDIPITADPVLRSAPPSLAPGAAILQAAGCPPKQANRPRIGWVMKADAAHPDFVARQAEALARLQTERKAEIVLLPFFRQQDLPVGQQLLKALHGSATLLNGEYTVEEVLSIIGNLDCLVGVRLHALIFAAVMQVPMLGISYDPKVASFLHALGQEPVSEAEGFSAALLSRHFDLLMRDAARLREELPHRVAALCRGLEINEVKINHLLEE